MAEELDLDAVAVPPDWTPVRDVPHLSPNTPFLSSAERLAVRYFTRGVEGEMVGFIRFGTGTQGPPGHAHGGSMASVLDEVMGFACWVHGHPVLAAHIEVDFRAPLPIPTIVMAEGLVTVVDGRKISAAGVLKGRDGTIYAESTGLFVRIDPVAVANMGQRTPGSGGAMTRDAIKG